MHAVLFVVVVSLLVVPLQMALVPLLRGTCNFGLTGTFLGIWLAHTGFGLPLAVYLLYNYISQLPKDLFESAYIDGASHFTAFIRLVLPAVGSGIGVVRHFPVSLGVERPPGGAGLPWCPAGGIHTHHSAQRTGRIAGQDWHVLTAGAFVTMVVPLIVFLLLQRYFVRGILAGSVKG